MNHRDGAAQNAKREENVVGIIKTVLFVIPPVMASLFAPKHDYLLFGASLIIGALLQAIVPPRRYNFFPILGIAVAGAIVYGVAQLRGWW